jgi:hypothetical protein
MELALAAITIKPPLRSTINYCHLDMHQSLPLNANIFKFKNISGGKNLSPQSLARRRPWLVPSQPLPQRSRNPVSAAMRPHHDCQASGMFNFLGLERLRYLIVVNQLRSQSQIIDKALQKPARREIPWQ